MSPSSVVSAQAVHRHWDGMDPFPPVGEGEEERGGKGGSGERGGDKRGGEDGKERGEGGGKWKEGWQGRGEGRERSQWR